MTYDLPELCRLTGVTPRTVRYYIQRGLLPSPGTSGPGAHYTTTYIDRLRLIRRWQRDHVPLAEIQQRLESMDDDAVRHALAGLKEPAGGEARAGSSSAADYVRRVLGEHSGSTSGSSPPAAADRCTWERIRVDNDVEIHVRRPLGRDQNRRVERLLEQARAIFEEP